MGFSYKGLCGPGWNFTSLLFPNKLLPDRQLQFKIDWYQYQQSHWQYTVTSNFMSNIDRGRQCSDVSLIKVLTIIAILLDRINNSQNVFGKLLILSLRCSAWLRWGRRYSDEDNFVSLADHPEDCRWMQRDTIVEQAWTTGCNKKTTQASWLPRTASFHIF